MIAILNNTTTIKPTTLLAISQQYGISKKTLLEMIRLTPELQQKIGPYTNGENGKKMRVLSIAVVRTIYEHLGYPEK